MQRLRTFRIIRNFPLTMLRFGLSMDAVQSTRRGLAELREKERGERRECAHVKTRTFFTHNYSVFPREAPAALHLPQTKYISLSCTGGTTNGGHGPRATSDLAGPACRRTRPTALAAPSNKERNQRKYVSTPVTSATFPRFLLVDEKCGCRQHHLIYGASPFVR